MITRVIKTNEINKIIDNLNQIDILLIKKRSY